MRYCNNAASEVLEKPSHSCSDMPGNLRPDSCCREVKSVMGSGVGKCPIPSKSAVTSTLHVAMHVICGATTNTNPTGFGNKPATAPGQAPMQASGACTHCQDCTSARQESILHFDGLHNPNRTFTHRDCHDTLSPKKRTLKLDHVSHTEAEVP